MTRTAISEKSISLTGQAADATIVVIRYAGVTVLEARMKRAVRDYKGINRQFLNYAIPSVISMIISLFLLILVRKNAALLRIDIPPANPSVSEQANAPILNNISNNSE